MKVKIIGISRKDAHYHERKDFIGQIGEFERDEHKPYKDWISGSFIGDELQDWMEGKPFKYYFAYIKYEEVE